MLSEISQTQRDIYDRRYCGVNSQALKGEGQYGGYLGVEGEERVVVYS
jgi:hypothetical protein